MYCASFITACLKHCYMSNEQHCMYVHPVIQPLPVLLQYYSAFCIPVSADNCGLLPPEYFTRSAFTWAWPSPDYAMHCCMICPMSTSTSYIVCSILLFAVGIATLCHGHCFTSCMLWTTMRHEHYHDVPFGHCCFIIIILYSYCVLQHALYHGQCCYILLYPVYCYVPWAETLCAMGTAVYCKLLHVLLKSLTIYNTKCITVNGLMIIYMGAD